MRDFLLKNALDDNDILPDEPQEIIKDGKIVMTVMETERRSRGRKAGLAGKTAEVGATASLNSHLVTQTSTMASHHAHLAATVGTGVMRVASMARFAGGALSAATMVAETKCMANTIRKIRAGNPCEKAEILHQIKSEIEHLPTTENLHQECATFLENMAQRGLPMTEDEVVRLLIDMSNLEESGRNEDELGQDDDTPDDEPAVPPMTETKGSEESESFMVDKQAFEESESYMDDKQIAPSSLILGRIKTHKQRNAKDSLRTDDSRDAVPIASLG